MNLNELKSKLDERKGERNQILNTIERFTLDNKKNSKSLVRHEQAREIIRTVGLHTQKQLQFHISDITSLALDSVFHDPYELVLEFIQRRNKTECDISFKRDGHKVDPKSASGGGAVDIATFALRIASWSMRIPRSRNVIILDEPMRFLSAEYREPASLMLKEISNKLGIQFIIITHDPVLATYADKGFKVINKNGISKVN